MADKPNRKQYQRDYYERTKEARKAKRKKQPRTESTRAAEARYRERKKDREAVLNDIAKMRHGPLLNCERFS